MATTADFRNGLCIQHNGEPWKIESFQHVKPGKGPAFVRTKIRNLNSGRLLENTFTSGVKIEIIRIEINKLISKLLFVCRLKTQISHKAVANIGKAKNSFNVAIHLPGAGSNLIRLGFRDRMK